jgi:ribose transport system permease protein
MISGKLLKNISSSSRLKMFLPSLAASVILLIIGQIIVPGFMSIGNLSSIFMTTGILGFMTIAQNTAIIAGKSGIDLSVGAVASFTAVLCPLLPSDTLFFLVITFAAAAVIGAVFGTMNGVGIQIFNIPPLIMTFIMGAVIDGAKLFFTRGAPPTRISPLLQSISNIVIQPFRILTICAVIIVFLMELALFRSKFGRSLRLVGDNPEAARLSGLRTRLIGGQAYAISAAFAGLMGLFLVGYAGSTTMTMGRPYTLLSVAAAAVGGTDFSGGKGSYISGFIGAFVLIVLTNILQAMNMPEGLRGVIRGVLLITIMIVNILSSKNRN